MLAIEGVAYTGNHALFRAVIYDHLALSEHLHDAVVTAAEMQAASQDKNQSQEAQNRVDTETVNGAR